MRCVVFRGIYEGRLDSKYRVSMPKRYRAALSEDYDNQLVVTIDTDSPCLLIYPSEIWVDIEKKIADLPSFSAAARRVQRLLVGHACDLDMDSQGRILLPALLRDYAQLQKSVIWLGQGNKFELWDQDLWLQHRDQWLQDYQQQEDWPQELQQLTL